MDDKIESHDWQLCFTKRWLTERVEDVFNSTWRIKDRLKTMGVALIMCPNVGIDPPDDLKLQSCARLECWVDPLLMSRPKALEIIGENLQQQYEKWQPRARYKQLLDPTVEEVRKLCISLRRNAKEERVLFHYNGHGVPKPTKNGEIWVFNKEYTQYIPLSMYDLQGWMESPSIYVYDCSNAGIIVKLFNQFADQREKELLQNHKENPLNMQPQGNYFKNCIQLAACQMDQILPMHTNLPADLFTSCLTTPIKMAARWFIMQNESKYCSNLYLGLVDKIPGSLSNRQTMLGELNWIFTAITDTIAWNVLPKNIFQTLFRQDLLVASLLRNFLLAERIMRTYECEPVSSPKLPPMYNHLLWKSWDHILDLCLSQLERVQEDDGLFIRTSFFNEQLTAFEIWLDHIDFLPTELRRAPEHLPIILQVLLSQIHRQRALQLFSRFLDLGPWAIHLALSVGLFPYILKLVQNFSEDLQPMLTHIWAKIMAVDHTCQIDIVRGNGFKYFTTLISKVKLPEEQRMLGTVVLAHIMQNYKKAQQLGLKGNLVSFCLNQLYDSNPPYKQWLTLCLAQLWAEYDEAREVSERDSAHEKLYMLLKSKVPEVRASAVFALGTYISFDNDCTSYTLNINQDIAITLLNTVAKDMSPIVREEVVIALQWTVFAFEIYFLQIALQEQNEILNESLNKNPNKCSKMLSKMNSNEKLLCHSSTSPMVSMISQISSGLITSGKDKIHSNDSRQTNSSSSIITLKFNNIHSKIWKGLTTLEQDSFPSVSAAAQKLTKYIRQKLEYNTHVLHSLQAYQSFKSQEESPPFSIHELYFGQRIPIKKRSPNSRTRQPNTILEDTNMLLSLSSSANIESDGENDNTGSKKKWLLKSKLFRVVSNNFIYTPNSSHVEDTLDYEHNWRCSQNTMFSKESQEEYNKTININFDMHQIFLSKCIQSPNSLAFHPHEPHIVVATKEYLTLWDYHSNYELNQWKPDLKNYNIDSKYRTTTSLSTVEMINCHDDKAFLLTAYNDGNIHIWSKFIDDSPKLVSGWHALPVDRSNLNNNGRSMVLHWNRRSSQLICAGDAKVIKIWDVQTETKLTALSTGVDGSVTNLSMQLKDNNIFAAGCNDGSIKIFDKRLNADNAIIASFIGNHNKILGLRLQDTTIVSADVNGDIQTFEFGQSVPQQKFHVNNMISADIHSMCNIIACGVKQMLLFYNTEGQLLNSLKLSEWFTGSRFTQIITKFHTKKVVLATGTMDGIISLYSIDPKKNMNI